MTPKPETKKPHNPKHRTVSFRKARLMREAEDASLLLEEVKDLQKKLDNLREYCHAEGYDIFNWEIKNIEVSE